MAEHGGNGSGGEVINRPEDAGGPMETETEDQQPAGAVESTSAVVAEGGDGSGDQQQEVGGGDEHRATEAEPRATEEIGVVGYTVEPLDPSTDVGVSVVTGRSSSDAEGSGAGGDETGPSKSKGKGVVTREEETTETSVEYREEDVLFRPTVISSSYWPIKKHNVAEHLPDEALAKLLEDNPMIASILLELRPEPKS
ncbi:hypothetical protein RHMOL_Rhmol10G0198300 [Rhododendron molle]|uniref:Uncharacterized protein n=1 Tax=Rhododendron molle TaxID=49168 RepID=A0ACC0M5Y7_RHOML|nr:hypothetical protein RHMOL_Rhmol10G0198300 [Rhododendron molle]